VQSFNINPCSVDENKGVKAGGWGGGGGFILMGGRGGCGVRESSRSSSQYQALHNFYRKCFQSVPKVSPKCSQSIPKVFPKLFESVAKVLFH
jgi:hypothetical protein